MLINNVTGGTYLGNPRLKKAGVIIPYSQEQYDEFYKCAKDPIYFITKYVKIINVDRGLINFDMYDYQKEMVVTFNSKRFIICKLPRQAGKSTTVVAYMLWLIIFTDNQSIAILANKGRLANDLLEKIKMAYEHLPMWLQQGIVTWNKGNIELENGSKILAAATSSSAVRGGSYNLIFLDEFAHIQRNIAEQFFSSVYPTISSGKTTKIIIVSTPKGMNHFYKYWMDATLGRSNYTAIEVHWRDIPGRDDAWREETIKNTSLEQFREEFETEFLGSVHTLISATKLRELTFRNPVKNNYGVDIFDAPVRHPENPRLNHSYVITVDTSDGVGLDYCAFNVIDITHIPYIQVAKFYDNNMSPQILPDILFRCAEHYNDAYILVETNDGNGLAVATALQQDLEYENVLSTVVKGRAGQSIGGGYGKRPKLGVDMTKVVKRIGCTNFKDLVESDKLIIQDFDTIQEMSNFVSKKNSFAAEEGEHDDLVMTLVIFAWLSRQVYFKELTNQDIRVKLAQDKLSMIENDMLPAGFIDNGEGDAVSIERPRFIDEWGNDFSDEYFQGRL